ncbi:hypothetical protein LLEC1_00720 [Akanthomyces lecanii]|uniref:Cytochrome P450 n=1 Tax=Cordyceps confragosa TaxID=2714763 RepID=A0A179IDQ2_CORDF|nr:hypothetical protein LLEC1_00720 [Akanthomyces lecanii]
MNHLTAFVAGQALHVLVFNRGEWDGYAKDIIAGSVLLNLGVAVALHATSSADNWGASFRASATLELAAIAGLFTSMLVYRAFFHALCKYPGPFAARLSNLHIINLSRRFRLYEEIHQLHARYGDIVRLGPSTLSVSKPEAVQAIHGPKSKCRKGPWYEYSKPLTSLHTSRDPAVHAQRRVSWERGLNSAGKEEPLLLFIDLTTFMRRTSYKPRVAQTTHDLLEIINASQGQVFNASKWFNLYSLEVMGWMAFGRALDALASGKETYLMELIHKTEHLFATIIHIPWLFVLIKQIPFLAGSFGVLRKWLGVQLLSQMTSPSGTACNLFSNIMEGSTSFEELTETQRLSLEGDMFLIVGAGSETVAMSLLALFYELSNHRDAQEKLQQEIDAYFLEHDEADPALLAKMRYLQACINETLRLWPPVPSGAQRITPPEGIHVGDAFIPGDTLVQVPTYNMHRIVLCVLYADMNADEEAFPRQDEFIPERWTTKPELIVDRSGYSPFSAGNYSCVGKQLALIELRQVAVEVLKRYTVELAPGFTSRDFEGSLADRFSMQAKRLDLVFGAR